MEEVMLYSPGLRLNGLALLLMCMLLPFQTQATSPSEQCRIGNRYLVGYQETVTRIDHQFDTRLTALIDSGSTTSSMDARDIIIKPMSNGVLWVQFKILTARGEHSREVTLFKPIIRYILVQTHRGAPQRRPVIEATIELGNVKTTTEFNLTSRSRFPQSILLGRNTLNDLAVIDTSQKYLLNGCQPDEDLVLGY